MKKFKLIKEYPGSVELGAIRSDCGTPFLTKYFTKYPEYWEEVVEKWLDEADLLTGDFPRSRYFLRVGDVLRSAVGFDDKQINRREELRMGAVLRTLGYTRRKLSDGGKKIWAYSPQVP
jgi:hypothetical protein